MNKTIVVTGIGHGVGLETAKIFSKSGFKVIATTRDIDKTIYKIKDFKDNIELYQVDFLKEEQVDEFCQVLSKNEIYALVNNSVLSIGNNNIEFDLLENWKKSYEVNIFSQIKILQSVIPKMKNAKFGHIFTISSIATEKVYPGGGHYRSSKSAQSSISESLRIELFKYGIRVTEIIPGSINTYGNNDTALDPKDVAESISWAMSCPKEVNVDKIYLSHISNI